MFSHCSMFLCLFNANIICLSCFCIFPTILSKSLFFIWFRLISTLFVLFCIFQWKIWILLIFYIYFTFLWKNHCFYARTIDLLNFLNFYTFFMKNNKNIDIAHFSVTGRWLVDDLVDEWSIGGRWVVDGWSMVVDGGRWVVNYTTLQKTLKNTEKSRKTCFFFKSFYMKFSKKLKKT